MSQSITPSQHSTTISPEALVAIETVVTERQRLVDEWLLRADNSLPPKETVFTAYNITVEARQKHQVWAEHKVVRDDVHAAVSMLMDQDECLIDIQNKANQPGYERPRLYHPPQISHQVAEEIFNNYGQIGINIKIVSSHLLPKGDTQSQPALPGPTASIAVIATSIRPTAIPGTGGKQQDGFYTSDKRGRLWIPADMLRNIGANIGDQVYVTKHPSALSITKMFPQGIVDAVVYRVDASNNIAVSKSAFDEAGLTSGKYAITDTITEVRIQSA